jgi:hypothetical protein
MTLDSWGEEASALPWQLDHFVVEKPLGAGEVDRCSSRAT